MKKVYYTLASIIVIFSVLILLTGCGTIGGAVDGAGDGDREKGAKKMYALMKKLEKKMVA